MQMGVQRKWMYLESIFIGSEDIRKQLPKESAMFDEVNGAWIESMARLQQAGTAYNGAMLDGMLEAFVSMDDKLDRIQKSLDEYLETKRQAFPRFYFLSNDDLLEILGQARSQSRRNHVVIMWCSRGGHIVITPSSRADRAVITW